ncbi:uncharacterized protein C11orf24 homolog [Chanos chanos]|uniref:Uncharacterized protein C11orf24 homolog n=1 Tax=Chanos chanos TaxID=29144 RepID=A0A6J2VDZ1_CHACN|nr:uncharacterized protein C11orf24 homolog [Chanos chanos]
MNIQNLLAQLSILWALVLPCLAHPVSSQAIQDLQDCAMCAANKNCDEVLSPSEKFICILKHCHGNASCKNISLDELSRTKRELDSAEKPPSTTKSLLTSSLAAIVASQTSHVTATVDVGNHSTLHPTTAVPAATVYQTTAEPLDSKVTVKKTVTTATTKMQNKTTVPITKTSTTTIPTTAAKENTSTTPAKTVPATTLKQNTRTIPTTAIPTTAILTTTPTTIPTTAIPTTIPAITSRTTASTAQTAPPNSSITTSPKLPTTASSMSSVPKTMPTTAPTVQKTSKSPDEGNSSVTGGTLPGDHGKTNKTSIDAAAGPLTSRLIDTSTLLALLLFGLLFFVVTVVLFVTQAYESYKKKDYTQVDYLINGMYSDSGV